MREQILNKIGMLSPNQLKKFKIIDRLKRSYPHVDSSMLVKDNHQLTLEEFTSIYFRSIVEDVAPGLYGKSAQEIILKMSTAQLERDVSKIESTASETYFKIILDALKKKLPGISEATISNVMFKTDQFRRLTKAYLKKYQDQYQVSF